MQHMDHQKLGFKCGLEIHQQIDSHKLFCSCPSIVNDDHEPDIFLERKLRAVAGESGTIDKAAQYEAKKDRLYKYQACSTSSDAIISPLFLSCFHLRHK